MSWRPFGAALAALPGGGALVGRFGVLVFCGGVAVSRLGFVGFCGSRALPSSAASLVARVVASVVRSGRGVAVGCASGADAFALSAALASGARLAVFAVGGPSRRGFWRCSAFSLVSRAAASGASVSWWAGGRCSCPSCSGSGSGRCPSLVGRLRRRSLAFVRFVAASGPGAGLVAFVSPGLSARSGGGAAGGGVSGGLLPFAAAVSARRRSLSAVPSLSRDAGGVLGGVGLWLAAVAFLEKGVKS